VLDSTSVTQREKAWKQMLGSDGAPVVFVAELDGVVVGFCVLEAPSRDDDADEGIAELAAINVDPRHWQSGIGAMLLEAARSELLQADWKAWTLWVLEGNIRACRFYARHGFSPDGGRKTDPHLGRAEVRLRAGLPRANAAGNN
jgi:GNAT superfamily N-acetyltransferase